MRKFLQILTILGTSFFALTAVAFAAPRQIVLVVAEGLSQPVTEFGTSYIRKADEDAEATTSFDSFKETGKVQTGGAIAIDSFKGLLEAAQASGYKTGLVTTADVTQVAPLFYDLPAGDAAATANTLAGETAFNVVAGGGRSHFGDDLTGAFKAAGGTVYSNPDGFDEEAKGKILALQSDNELSYAIDRVQEDEASLGDLVTLAADALGGENNAPYLLVVHDTLLAKALNGGDSPAVVEQFRELSNITADLLARRDENSDLAVVVLGTGGTQVPRFVTQNPAERSNALFILSNLPLSFARAGSTLTGATDEKIDDFSTEQYKGWKISPEARAALLAGTLQPEKAIRESYEPALKLSYAPGENQATVYTAGIDTAGSLVETLQKWAGAKAVAARP
jgi:hypothetical protein